MCLLRLSPILPYNILNYAAALTPISFLAYTLSSALAIIPWTVLYVYLGEAGLTWVPRGWHASGAVASTSCLASVTACARYRSCEVMVGRIKAGTQDNFA